MFTLSRFFQFLATAILISFLPRILSAQTASSSAMKGAIVSQHLPVALLDSKETKNHSIPAKTEEAETELSYYDILSPTTDWLIGGLYNPVILAIVGERMTLPWSEGYVDSVSFWTDGGNADTLTVGLFSTILTSDGFLVIDPNAEPVATIDVPVSPDRQDSNEYWTIPFDHIQVPQDFAIGIIPNINTELNQWNYMKVRGDRDPTRPLDPETTRSLFVGLEGSQSYSSHLDGIFTLANETDPLFSNLYITGYVSQGAATVSQTEHSAPAISIYPNPASDYIRVSKTPVGSTIRIVNTLGQTVLQTTQSATNELVNVRQLSAGAYSVLVSNSQGVVRRSVSLER